MDAAHGCSEKQGANHVQSSVTSVTTTCDDESAVNKHLHETAAGLVHGILDNQQQPHYQEQQQQPDASTRSVTKLRHLFDTRANGNQNGLDSGYPSSKDNSADTTHEFALGGQTTLHRVQIQSTRKVDEIKNFFEQVHTNGNVSPPPSPLPTVEPVSPPASPVMELISEGKATLCGSRKPPRPSKPDEAISPAAGPIKLEEMPLPQAITIDIPLRSPGLPRSASSSSSIKRGSITMRTPPTGGQAASMERGLDLLPRVAAHADRSCSTFWNRESVATTGEPFEGYEFPDGIFVRTGQFYEQVDIIENSNLPLGHWVTTVFNPPRRSKRPELPMTQVTNIWMTERASRRPAVGFASRETPITSNNNNAAAAVPPCCRYNSLPCRSYPGYGYNTGQATHGHLERPGRLAATAAAASSHSGRQSRPFGGSLRGSANKRAASSPSPNPSWLSPLSMSPPPPFRTRSLTRWGSDGHGLDHRASSQRLANDRWNDRCGRTPPRSVSFCDKPHSLAKRTRSPTPLFGSQEQVENRIRELRNLRRPHVASRSRPDYAEWLAKARQFNSNRRKLLAEGTNNTEDAKTEEAHPTNSLYINAETDDLENIRRATAGVLDSGVDTTSISADFQEKCAYFEDIGFVERMLSSRNQCTCHVHCPVFRSSEGRVNSACGNCPHDGLVGRRAENDIASSPVLAIEHRSQRDATYTPGCVKHEPAFQSPPSRIVDDCSHRARSRSRSESPKTVKNLISKFTKLHNNSGKTAPNRSNLL